MYQTSVPVPAKAVPYVQLAVCHNLAFQPVSHTRKVYHSELDQICGERVNLLNWTRVRIRALISNLQSKRQSIPGWTSLTIDMHVMGRPLVAGYTVLA